MIPIAALGLIKSWWKAGVAIIAVLAVAGTVWAFADHYYDRGVAVCEAKHVQLAQQAAEDRKKDLDKAIELLRAQTKRLREQEKEIEKFDEQIAAAKAAAAANSCVIPESVLAPLRKIR